MLNIAKVLPPTNLICAPIPLKIASNASLQVPSLRLIKLTNPSNTLVPSSSFIEYLSDKVAVNEIKLKASAKMVRILTIVPVFSKLISFRYPKLSLAVSTISPL